MSSSILHPGNGINYNKKGDYVKINLQMKDSNDNIIFDSTLSRRIFCEIRYLTNENNNFSLIKKRNRRYVNYRINKRKL